MAIERAVAWAYLPFFEGGVVLSAGGLFVNCWWDFLMYGMLNLKHIEICSFETCRHVASVCRGSSYSVVHFNEYCVFLVVAALI